MSGGIGPYKNVFRKRLYDEQGGLCYYCQKRMSFNRKKTGAPARDFATFEHLVRRQQGGQVNSVNIVLAHYKCNVLKNIEWQAIRKGGREAEGTDLENRKR